MLLKATVGVAIVAIIWWKVRSASEDLSGGFPGMGGFSWYPAIACLLLLPANIGLDVRVWRILLAAASVPLARLATVRAVLAGFAAAAISPGGVGDFVGRAVRIPADKRWITSITMALGRIADGAIICIVGVVCALFVFPFTVGATRLWVIVVAAIAVPLSSLLLLVFFARTSMTWLSGRLGRWPSLLHALNLATGIPLRPRLEAVAWASVRYVVFTTQFMLAVAAFGTGGVGLPLLAAGTATIYLLRNVAPPLTFMGLGIREAASVAVLGLVGVPEESALYASLLVFAVNLALPALVGIPYLLSARREDVSESGLAEVSHA